LPASSDDNTTSFSIAVRAFVRDYSRTEAGLRYDAQ
jgi:hypothetical protein